MSLFRLPLVHDRRADRTTSVAALELTETDLRVLALAASHAAINPPLGWSSADDVKAFDGLGRRMKRVADELRRAHIENGAATADTVPRPGSLEVTQ